MNKESFVIIGAGPVGLCAALLLHKLGCEVAVYEMRSKTSDEFETSRSNRKMSETYPVGLNPRAMHCLDLIDPLLKDKILEKTTLVDAWKVIVGKMTVVTMKSGYVHCASRDVLTNVLYEACVSRDISFHFSHKLLTMNMSSKTLSFENQDGLLVTLDCTRKRVIACDGANSVVRSCMEKDSLGFQCESTPWKKDLRFLYSSPNAIAPNLNPSNHYIINGNYVAPVRDANNQLVWAVGLTLDSAASMEADNTSALTSPASTGTTSSAALTSALTGSMTGSTGSTSGKVLNTLRGFECNYDTIQVLRGYLQDKCPQVLPLFPTNEACIDFFKYKCYRGKVISVTKLHHDEFVLLLGDSAHSVIPPLGEGLNAGLEDCAVLYETMRLHTHQHHHHRSYFADYNTRRMPDVHGLVTIAKFMNENMSVDLAEYSSRVSFTVLQSLLRDLGIFQGTLEGYTLGNKALERKPYSEIASMWLARKNTLLPLCRIVCYPITYALKLFNIPKTIASGGTANPNTANPNATNTNTNTTGTPSAAGGGFLGAISSQ